MISQIITPLHRMIELIKAFIDSKHLSDNTRQSYFYDLKQFEAVVDHRLSQERLALYEQSLSDLKLSARKRKISAVNQFLYYLYSQGEVDRFYKLTIKEKLAEKPVNHRLLDLSVFYADSQQTAGQLIALLIVELGLQISEIAQLEQVALDLDFLICQLRKGDLVRIVRFPRTMLPYLEQVMEKDGTYLFEHAGKPYSRQWLLAQLKLFLREQNLPEFTAQTLREQYILHQKEAGKSIFEVSQSLGLRSPVTLEKYFRN